MKVFVHTIEESIKALYVSMDESRQRTALIRSKHEMLEKAFSCDFMPEKDVDLKMIGSSPIDSFFPSLRLLTKGLDMIQLPLEGVPNFLRTKILLKNLQKVGMKRSKLFLVMPLLSLWNSRILIMTISP
jgi:hypothetical protein